MGVLRDTKEKTNQNGKRGKRDDGHAVTYEIAYAGEAQRGMRDTTDMRAFIDVFVTYNELVMMVVSGEKGLEYLNRASQSLDISTERIWSISSHHTSDILIPHQIAPILAPPVLSAHPFQAYDVLSLIPAARLRCQYLQFRASKASKSSTFVLIKHGFLKRQYLYLFTCKASVFCISILYFCTRKESKLRTQALTGSSSVQAVRDSFWQC